MMGERLTYSSTLGSTATGGNDLPGSAADGQEVMVVDTRGQLRPAEMVERKLVHLLRGGPLPVSHVSAALRKR
jgi:hypothetical protein